MRRFFARRRYQKAVDEALSLMSARKPAEARVVLRRAAADAKEAFGDAGVDVATVHYALAANELEAGELDAALANARTSEQALVLTSPAERKAAAPDEVPSLTKVRALISAVLERLGAPVEDLDRALLEWSDAARTDADDEAAGAALNQLGLALGRRGDREAAAARFLEALEHRTRRFGRDGLPTLETLYNAATYRDAARTLDVVASDLERIVSVLEGRAGSREADLYESSLHNLAALREEQGDVDEAERLFEKTLASKERRLGSTHASLRPTLVRLAQIHHRSERLIHALGLYDRALAIAKREHGDDHPVVVAIEAWRSEVTQGLGPAAIRRN